MRTTLRLALVLLITACDSTTPAPSATSILLDRTAVTLDDGDTTRLTVTVLDQRGNPMDSLPSSTPLTWTTSAASVVVVEDGLVRGVAPGEAEIVARVGSAKATAAVEVRAVAVGMRPTSSVIFQGTVATPLDDSIGVQVFDRSRRPVPGVPVHFAVMEGGGAVSNQTTISDAGGYARALWVLGDMAGQQRVEVRADGLGGYLEFVAIAAPGPPSVVRSYSGNSQPGSPGLTLPLPVRVRVEDAHENPIEGLPIEWLVTSGGGTISPDEGLTDPLGLSSATWVLGASGDQLLTATLDGVGTALFSASLDGSTAAPTVSSIAPVSLRPGETAVMTGERFGSDLSAVRVTVADVEVEVTGVVPSSLEFRMPGRQSLPCQLPADVAVVVTVDGASGAATHLLEVPLSHSLAPGEAVELRSGGEISCSTLPHDGEYLIAVASTASSLGGMVPIHVSGLAPDASPNPVREPSQISHDRAGAMMPLHVDDSHHEALLERSRRTLESHPPARRSARDALFSMSGAALPQVGDTLAFRVPDIASSDLCSAYFTTAARVVYVGEWSVALEDIAAPLAGSMDARIQALAAEYDARMHPLLLEYFGDPLAFDEEMGGAGRVFMYFTEHVNDAQAQGFVWGGNFSDSSSCAASNEAPILYASVPTVDAEGFGEGTPESWSWTVRNVVVHEVKHLASYAERLAVYAAGGGLRLEDVWLEESTARAAEEIWARMEYGYDQGGNATYAGSLYCEVRPAAAECEGLPLVMMNHFRGLNDWYRSGGSRSPLGRVGARDFSYYGSGWSLVRWAADHSGQDEARFFRDLTTGRDGGSGSILVGTENLAARTGRDFPDIVQHWAVAMAVDDYPGMVAENPLHTFPSWNLRDVFAGLHADLPTTWTEPFPALAREVPLDGSRVSFHELSGGSAAYWSVRGGGSVVEIRGSQSIGLAPHVQVVVIRVR